ncbi:MAG TPA: hypothetical protein VJ794_08310 [Gemmatimonadales bacterium]|nr:hypothetical protein [Gemmatimonadales bacterium]
MRPTWPMDLIGRVLTHPWARRAWMAAVFVLAACNNGDSGGGNGY